MASWNANNFSFTSGRVLTEPQFLEIDGCAGILFLLAVQRGYLNRMGRYDYDVIPVLFQGDKDTDEAGLIRKGCALRIRGSYRSTMKWANGKKNFAPYILADSIACMEMPNNSAPRNDCGVSFASGKVISEPRFIQTRGGVIFAVNFLFAVRREYRHGRYDYDVFPVQYEGIHRMEHAKLIRKGSALNIRGTYRSDYYKQKKGTKKTIFAPYILAEDIAFPEIPSGSALPEPKGRKAGIIPSGT